MFVLRRVTSLFGSRPYWLIAVAIALVAFAVTCPLRAELPPEAANRMLSQLKVLASDEFEGRGVGTEGLNRAAVVVRDAFADAGLDVTAVDGGAFQTFEVVTGSELESPNELTFISADGTPTALVYDEQFRTCSFGAAGAIRAPLVFCGYGIVSEEPAYNDFADVDLEGKVAVILRRTPQQGDEEGLFGGPHSGTSRHAALNTKLKNAIDHGAVAVLFVNDAYSGVSELAKLNEQRETAEQRVIEAAIGFVDGHAATPHDHDHAHGDPHAHHPHAETSDTQPKQGDGEPTSGEGTVAPSDPEVDQKSAPADPHHPHAGAPPHGHGAVIPDQSLIAAVTHLKEVRKLVEEYDPDPLMEFGYNGNRRGESVPVFHVKHQTMDEVVKAALGQSLEDLESAIDSDGKPRSIELTGYSAAGETALRIIREEVKNVIGVLPGQGPLYEETIVVGAHYDHLGLGGEGSLMPGSTEVHNGADDNASGTVALIELARRLASRSEPLPRRVVFIAFTGEERGLLGSAHYVKEPEFPNEKTIAMFNMDMVGRMQEDKLTVFGTGTATRWDALLDQEAGERQFKLSKKEEGFGPSDHSSFYAKQIPVLHFFTGTHNDYHRPTDDWEKLNIEGMGRIVDLLEELIVSTAVTQETPKYVAIKGRAEMQERTGSRPYFGSIPDFGGEEVGYALQGVSPGSPADKGGIKGGDVIIKLGALPITGLDDFDLALREFSAGEEVPVVVRRDGEELTLRVTLATPR
ncbi:MAG: M20/M25/M40 family metallo-hydrolase [Planctomycetaceae bacterium]|nr:M20/M25/M40 family metallo-hydrolase [Planctomycetaceae bacterium]